MNDNVHCTKIDDHILINNEFVNKWVENKREWKCAANKTLLTQIKSIIQYSSNILKQTFFYFTLCVSKTRVWEFLVFLLYVFRRIMVVLKTYVIVGCGVLSIRCP